MSSNTEELKKLTLKGRFGIGNAQTIYDQVRVSLKTSNYLNIYLSEISEIDLSFLQILYSLLATAFRKGKEMSVFVDNPVVIWDIIVNAGFESHFSVNVDPDGANFQIEGNFR